MKYGLVPSFKAGVHYGEVTVGEIGVVKRQIIFTGDVLNTTSRIQELCNKYNQKLIVSKDLLDLINVNDDLFTDEIGQMNLRHTGALPGYLLIDFYNPVTGVTVFVASNFWDFANVVSQNNGLIEFAKNAVNVVQ